METSSTELYKLLQNVVDELEEEVAQPKEHFASDLLNKIKSKLTWLNGLGSYKKSSTFTDGFKKWRNEAPSQLSPMSISDPSTNLIGSLPPELLMYIFSSPALRYQWGSLSLVCTHWHQIVKELRQTRRVMRIPYDARLLEIGLHHNYDHFRKPTELVLHAVQHQMDRKFQQLESVTALTVLCSDLLLDGFRKVPHAYTAAILPHLPNLKSFTYQVNDMSLSIMEYLKQMTSLTELNFEAPWGSSWPVIFEHTIEISTRLWKLSIGNDPGIHEMQVSPQSMVNLGRNCVQLRSLTLELLDEGCQHVISELNSPYLEHAHFNQMLSQSELKFDLIGRFCGRHFNTLKTLQLSGKWQGVNEVIPKYLLNLWTKIEHLALDVSSIPLAHSHCKYIATNCKNLKTAYIMIDSDEDPMMGEDEYELSIRIPIEVLKLLFHQCIFLQRVTVESRVYTLTHLMEILCEYNRSSNGFYLNANKRSHQIRTS